MTTDSNNFDFDDWEDRINDYLKGKLTDAERTQFEAALSNSTDLQEAVAFEKALNQQATEHFLFQHLKPKMDDFVKNNLPDDDTDTPTPDTQNPTKGPLSIKSLLGALLLILMVCVGVYVFNRYQKTKIYDQITATWLTNAPLPYDNTNLANFQTGQDSLAIQAYIKGDYTKAESFFSQNDAKQTNAFGPRGLYRAVNALMILPPKTDKAIEILSFRNDNPNTFRHDAVEWYLALAFLQKKDVVAAKRILQGISKDSEFAAKAEALLQELQRNKF
jgi:hypothetical protein